MKLSDEVELATRMVRRLKEDLVRKHKGRVDLDTTIVCYRGEDPVALITLPPDRNALLQVARIAAQGFGPDILSLTHDTYMASGSPEAVKDPRTGELWTRDPNGPGAMQTYVEEFGFDGTVTECLTTHVLNRAGDSATVPQPYEVDGKTVTWTPMETKPGMKFTGDVPEGLKEAMAARTLDQIVPGAAYELVDDDAEKARWHFDLATVRVIAEKIKEPPVVVQLFAKRGSPREQLFRTKLARSEVVDPSQWN